MNSVYFFLFYLCSYFLGKLLQLSLHTLFPNNFAPVNGDNINIGVFAATLNIILIGVIL